jgi:AcrR family transcriptional regulator
MKQAVRSERSRAHILDAALKLFSSRGYRATNMRDIAQAAGVSTGNVYHQFPDKESIFKALLDDYFRLVAEPDFPLQKALSAGAFPDDLGALGRAAREVIERYRPYVALIYVDVVEFEGLHIRKFYSDAAQRFEHFLASDAAKSIPSKLRVGVSPRTAIMFATRFLYQYFVLEVLFGVPNYFGNDPETALREITDILAHGILTPTIGTT